MVGAIGVRITALLSWWDEDPDWLGETVRSLGLAGVKTLIAADGAYTHMPGGTACFPLPQHDAIFDASEAAGIRPKRTIPGRLWESECVKRDTMFRRAEIIKADWYLIIDA